MTKKVPSEDASEAPSRQRRVSFDPDTPGEPSISIVNEVATATSQDPAEMEPLASTVDTDALDALVKSARRDPNLVHISFTYEGMDVTVDSGGMLRIEPKQV